MSFIIHFCSLNKSEAMKSRDSSTPVFSQINDHVKIQLMQTLTIMSQKFHGQLGVGSVMLTLFGLRAFIHVSINWYLIGDTAMDTHDDVIKWKHFPRYWLFVRGFHRSPVNSPHKGQWRGALMFSFSIACPVADQRKHRNSESLAFVRGTHRWPVDSPHKGPVTRKMFPFDDAIMHLSSIAAMASGPLFTKTILLV